MFWRRPVLLCRAAWAFDAVDPSTGRTALEARYDAQLQRIRRVFEQPLPPLPRDGTVEPSLLVGFAHYDYRLRDQYRAVLAAALGVPVAHVKLSVAWSGRFDASRFNRVQKVCGVVLAPPSSTETENKNKNKNNDNSEEEKREVRVAELVRAINARRTASLLAAHIVQASGAVPEVQFAAAQREAAAAARLHHWIRAEMLQPHLVVVVVSEKEREKEKEKERDEEAVSERWVKALHRRRVVPRVVSVEEIARAAADAVKERRVEGLSAQDKKKNKKEDKEEEEEVKEAKEKEKKEEKEEELLTTPPMDDDAVWCAFVRRALFDRSDGRAGLPLLFVHGECAGGAEEMRYLVSNREALDALLLHPNDVAFKRRFLSRFRASHSRLTMATEMSLGD